MCGRRKDAGRKCREEAPEVQKYGHGDERIADVGGQPKLPPPRGGPPLDNIWSMPDIAKSMEINSEKGSLIGAGAGPFHVFGPNCEPAPNLSWREGLDKADKQSRFAGIDRDTGSVNVRKSLSLDCALIINLSGSLVKPGLVIKITARNRKGAEKSFTECIRKGIHTAYGDSKTVSLGGVFLVRSEVTLSCHARLPLGTRANFQSRQPLE